MLVTHVIVDGTVIESWDRKSEFLVPRRTALTLGIDGFLEITMQDPPPWIVAKYADTADHLEGSSDSLLMLPVTKLTVTPFSAARNNELLPTHA